MDMGVSSLLIGIVVLGAACRDFCGEGSCFPSRIKEAGIKVASIISCRSYQCLLVKFSESLSRRYVPRRPFLRCQRVSQVDQLSLLNSVHCVCLSLSSEVRQSLSNAQSQYSQWNMLLESEVDIDKIQNVSTELKNCIKSIEWDLEDLDQTISESTYC